MNVGIVGMPSSGKTTLFRALTRGTVKTDNPGRANIGVVSVPDKRIDYVWLRGLIPTRAWVADTLASDHRLVVTEVQVPR